MRLHPDSSVSVVIANYNGERYLPSLMASLAGVGTRFREVIVVDDASSDASRLLLRHRWPEVRLIGLDRNRGAATARNEGLRAAAADLVLFLDNDTFPEPGSIEPLIRAMGEDPGLVAVAPRVLLDGEAALIHADGGHTHLTGQMWLENGYRPIREARSSDRPPTSLLSAALLVRRTPVLEIGGFAPAFFIYYEDHDLATRLHLSGGDLRVVTGSRVRNQSGTQGLSFRSGGVYAPRRAYLTIRNRWLFMLRVLRRRTLLALAPALLVFELAQAAFAFARGFGEAWWAALSWNLGRLGQTVEERSRVQQQRRRGDAELLESGPLPLHPGLLREAGLAAKARGGVEVVIEQLARPLLRWVR